MPPIDIPPPLHLVDPPALVRAATPRSVPERPSIIRPSASEIDQYSDHEEASIAVAALARRRALGTRVVTWNPADSNAHAVLSGGNLIATGDAAIWASARATHGIGTADKRYWEVNITLYDNVNLLHGIADSGMSLADDVIVGLSNVSASFGSSNNNVSGGTLAKSYTGTDTNAVNDVMMFARSSDKLWVGKNGTWYNLGDPAADTGEWLTGLSTTVFYPACSVRTGTACQLVCLPASLTYSPPSTFKALGLL